MQDVNQIRKDFPMLNGKKMSGQPLVYLDNAATTFKPQSVIDAVVNAMNSLGNAGRGVHEASLEAAK